MVTLETKDISILLSAVVFVSYIVSTTSKKDDKSSTPSTNTDSDSTTNSTEPLKTGKLDLRRKYQIATGRVADHRHDAILRKINIDLDKTIFANVKSVFSRYALQQQLGWESMWSDESVARITDLYETKIPSYPPIPQKILDFMVEDCNFRVEHADGSFMDHLKFLYDFTHTWYKKDALGHESAPLVMLLHSITGVGTNFFPMEASKLPKLQTLLTDDVFKHVVIFPSFLRLFKQRTFIRDLQSHPNLDSIKSITLHRIIDNEKMTLSTDEMWVALNYQFIHSLDFLPLTHLGHARKPFPYGSYHPDSPFLHEYHELYHLLTSKDKLFVDVKPIELLEEEGMKDCPPRNIYSLVKMMLPSTLVCKLVERITSKNIQKFSDQIGHSLEYEFAYV